MSSVNKAIIIGNLGSDPEIRSTQDGKRIANFSVATSEKWKDKTTGEKKESTQWHRIVIFNEKLAEVTEKYLKKGSKVYIEGAMQTRKWTDSNGIERYVTEVIVANYRGNLSMLDGKSDSSNTGIPPHTGENQADHNSNTDNGYSSEDYRNKEMQDEGFPDDEIPF